MGDMQATIGGTALDNGTWRRMDDVIAKSVSADRMAVVVLKFIVHGDTVAQLQERWLATEASFNGNDKALLCTLDTAAAGAGQYLINIAKYDGTYGRTACAVTDDPNSKPTQLSKPGLIVFHAEVIKAMDSAGLIDEPTLVISLNAGRVESRSLLVSYGPANGSTGKTLYEAARSTYLTTWLKTGSGGARDATTGLALVMEEVETGDPTGQKYTVALRSEWMPKAMSTTSSARSFNLTVKSDPADRWHTGASPGVVNGVNLRAPNGISAGAQPEYLTVSCTVDIDKSVYTGELYEVYQASLLADINAAVREAALDGEAINFLQGPSLSVDLKQSRATYNAVIQKGNSSVLSYDLAWRDDQMPTFIKFAKGDGTHGLQQPPTPDDRTITVSVARTGIGFTQSLTCPAPTESGYEYIPVGKSAEISDTMDTPFGLVYSQSAAFKFERCKFGGGTSGNRIGSVVTFGAGQAQKNQREG